MRSLVLSMLLVACPGPIAPTDAEPDPGAAPTAPGGVSLEPAEPDTLAELRLVVGEEPTDVDGDYEGLQIRWSREGEAVPDLDDALQVPASETRRDQVWQASVAGVDAAGHVGTAATASVQIHNLPPGAPTVSIFPVAPVAGVDDLICSATSTDLDEDAISYRFTWTSGSQVIEGGVVSADTLRGHDVWTCTAVASDGTADSDSVEASITVLAPPIPYFTLVDRNPSSPRHRRDVSPRDYLEKVSGWYFTHAT